MAALYVFPDTNILLHFRRLNEIDWIALTGNSPVIVVLAPVVTEELDDLKNRQDSRKIKQRARDLNTWVRERWRGADKLLREGVTLEFATSEDDEFLTGGLVARIKDDRLIASALGYAAAGKNVALITNDTGPLIKAEGRGLRVIEPADDLALPLERDEVEKERDALLKERNLERSRAPKLEIDWSDEMTGGRITIPVYDALPKPRDIRQAYPRMLKRSEANANGVKGATLSALMGVPDSSIETYNAQLERFYVAFENGRQQAVEAVAHNRRLVDLRLVLKNMGAASATHISVRVDLPPTIMASDDLEQREVPSPPQPPERPGPFGITKPIETYRFPSHSLAHLRGYEPHLPVYDPYAPSIDDAGRVATWNCNRLIHSDVEILKPLPCLIAPELIGRSAIVKVTIHAEEQRHPISHELEVSFIESAGNVG